MLKVLFGAISVYAALAILLFLIQRSMLYFPTPAYSASGNAALSLNSDGINLTIETNNLSSDTAILYFGGNAESAYHSIRQMQPLFGDHALYFMNYRGYGGSGGKPTEQGLYQDALALYDYVAQRHGQIRLVGRSLGTGIVTFLASQREVKQIVLISPYDSIAEVAAGHYPIFPVKWLIKDRYDSYSRAESIRCPSLILAARQDQIVPVRHTQRLVEAMKNSEKTVRIFEGVGHNTTDSAQGFDIAIIEFLSRK